MTVPISQQQDQQVTIGVLALQGAFIEHVHYLQRLQIEGVIIKAVPIRTAKELQVCDALVIPGGESTVIQSVASNTPGLLPLLQTFVRDPERPVWGTCAGMILMASEDGIGGGKVPKGKAPQKGWEGIDGLKVWRNLYGTQLESFEAHLDIPALRNPESPFNCIFIRAPAVHSLRPPKSPANHHDQQPNGIPDVAESVGTTYLPTPDKTISKPFIPVEVLATLPSICTAPPPPSDTPLGPPDLDDLGKVMIRQGKKMVTSFHPELSGDTRIHQYWVEHCVLGR